MQLVPLPTGGRVTAVVTAPAPPGPLRVVLRLEAGNVVIEALHRDGPRRVGRLTAEDAAAYRPVLARLAGHGHAGTCPARMIGTGETAALVLHLGSPASCTPDAARRRAPAAVARAQTPPAWARTTRLRATVPAARTARPHRTCPSRPGTAPPPRAETTAHHDDRRPAAPGSQPRLAARPAARFGQPDDAAPRLTRDQRRRVLGATVAIAAALLLASLLQHSGSAPPPPAGAVACAEGRPACR